jgi:VanZ family protein
MEVPLNTDMKKKPRTLISYWIPVLFWLSIIFWMATESFSAENTYSVAEFILRSFFPAISRHALDLFHAVIRKSAHVVEYFILSLLLFRAFRNGSSVKWKWQWALLAVIGVSVWALTDELHQSFTATRTASLIDVGIDTAGGVLAQILRAAWHRFTARCFLL